MGCDIHVMLEKKYKYETSDGWVSVNQLPINTGRNYQFFTQLASVRGDSDRLPKGMPEDACLRTHYEAEQWGQDGHSHSWMLAEEFLELYVKHALHPEKVADAMSRKLEGESDNPFFYDLLGKFGYECDDDETYIEDFRFVFWFDN